jgi:hypothetical protein
MTRQNKHHESESHREHRRDFVKGILGFKKLIEDSQQSPEKVAAIGELLQAAKDELRFNPDRRTDRDPSDPKIFFAQNFSDLTVRVRFLDGDLARRPAVNELAYLAGTQMTLMIRDNLLVRGGVCEGDIVASTGVIYGPALVKAYALESEYAIYPRVVVDRRLADELLALHDESTTNMLRRGEDGSYFVDYLFTAVVFDLMVGEWRDARSQIDDHRAFVQEQIGDGIRFKPERVKQKLMWLALYHNATIEKLRTHPRTEHSGARLDNLDIPADSLRF